MEWSLFALLQMFVITIGVSVAFWLRIRSVQQQNEDFRTHLEALEAIPAPEIHPAPDEWVKEKCAGLPDSAASSPIVALTLKHVLQSDGQFEENLVNAIEVSNLVPAAQNSDDPAQAERIEALETELAAAKTAVEDAGAAPSESVGDDQTEELRQLLQQFTKDSREMMACIHTLESENADLRAQLGIEDAPAADPSANESVTESASEGSVEQTTDTTTEDADTADIEQPTEDVA